MAKVLRYSQTEINTMEILNMDYLMEKVYTNGLMETNMRATLKEA